MSQDHNPFAAPRIQPGATTVSGGPKPATQGTRFTNFIIDVLIQYGISFVIGLTLATVGGKAVIETLQGVAGHVLGFTVVFVYYFVLEATTGKTIGKMVTGTVVVDEHGGKPSTGQIAGRTLCRFIPFEAFSFLGAKTYGWHDSIPKTYVVKQR